MLTLTDVLCGTKGLTLVSVLINSKWSRLSDRQIHGLMNEQEPQKNKESNGNG